MKGRARGTAFRVLLLGLSLTFAGLSAVAAAEPPLSGNFLPAIIATSEPHRNALVDLIRGKPGLPAWVRNMVSRDRYVALASSRVDVEGRAMQLFAACQPGNCAESAIRLLFTEDGKRVVMRISDLKLGTVVLGEPSPDELAVLAAQ